MLLCDKENLGKVVSLRVLQLVGNQNYVCLCSDNTSDSIVQTSICELCAGVHASLILRCRVRTQLPTGKALKEYCNTRKGDNTPPLPLLRRRAGGRAVRVLWGGQGEGAALGGHREAGGERAAALGLARARRRGRAGVPAPLRRALQCAPGEPARTANPTHHMRSSAASTGKTVCNTGCGVRAWNRVV